MKTNWFDENTFWLLNYIFCEVKYSFRQHYCEEMRDLITLCPPDDMSHFPHNLIFTNLLIDAHHLLSLQLFDQGLNLEMNLSDSEGSRQLWFWMRDVGSITQISGPFLWVCLLVFLFLLQIYFEQFLRRYCNITCPTLCRIHDWTDYQGKMKWRCWGV